MSMDLEEQYDRIYRYCYFKIRHRELAEDITQETFLRFFEYNSEMNKDEAMRFLYTVARNLCVSEYRRRQSQPLKDEIKSTDTEDTILISVAVQTALMKLDSSDRKLLLLRYVNEIPVSVIGKLQGISRFSVRCKIMRAVKNFKRYLGKEDLL